MSESPYMRPVLRNMEWELEASKTEVSTLQLAVSVLKTENEIIEDKLKDREKKNETLNTELERAKEKLRDAIRIYKANEEEFQERISFLESNLEEGSKELTVRVEYLERKLESSSEQLQLKESELQHKEKELKEKEKDLEKREKEWDRVKDFFAAGNDINGLVLDLQGRIKKQEEELRVKEHQIVSLRVNVERVEQERLAVQQTLLNQPKSQETAPPPSQKSPKPRQRSASFAPPLPLRKQNSRSVSRANSSAKTNTKRWSVPEPDRATTQAQRWGVPEPDRATTQAQRWGVPEPPITENRIYDDPIFNAPDYNRLDWEQSRTIDQKRKIVGGVAVYSQKENSLYFSSILQQDILVYKEDQSWEYVPPCPHKFFGLAIVEDNITAIGGEVRERPPSEGASGQRRLRCTNKLLSFTAGSSEGDGQWVELFPPMPTARAKPSTICTSQALVVAGGDNGHHLSSVETMDLLNKQWCRAAFLPKILAHPQMVLSESIGQIYLTGEDLTSKEQAMYNCSVGELLATKESASEETSELAIYEEEPFYTPSPLTLKASRVWKELPNVPRVSSTLAIVNNQVMVAGGIDKARNISNEIYSFNVSHNEWEHVSHMPTARHKALMGYNSSSKTLIVIGGFTRIGPINTIDIATLKS